MEITMTRPPRRGQRRPGAAELPVGDVNNVSVTGVNALGKLEAEVMDAVWLFSEPVTVAEVLATMQEREERATPKGQRPRRIAYTTVLTTVTRLRDKGYLHQDRSAHTYRYTPVMSKEEYEHNIARKLVEAGMQISPSTALEVLLEITQRGVRADLSPRKTEQMSDDNGGEGAAVNHGT